MSDFGPPGAPTPPPGGQQYPAQPPGSPGYPAPQYGYGYPAPGPSGSTNGFAIASLVCAFLCWPLGLIFGLVAKSQIKAKNEGGNGLATAGIVISAVFAVLTVVYLILLFTVLHTVTNGFNPNTLNELNNIFNSPTP